MRLSLKQRVFLAQIAAVPLYQGRRSSLYWQHAIAIESFFYEREYLAWVRRIDDRGLIRIEQDFFFYLTPEGEKATAKDALCRCNEHLSNKPHACPDKEHPNRTCDCCEKCTRGCATA